MSKCRFLILTFVQLSPGPPNPLPSDAKRSITTGLPSTIKPAVYAPFGGQGANEYLDELQDLYNIYKLFVATITKGALQPLSEARSGRVVFNFGMNVYGWLAGTVPRPPLPYLVSVTVPLPLIGLTQPIQYVVACRVSGSTAGEFRSRISGTTGHSQSIVSAVAIAASTSFESLTLSCKAVKWLVRAGCRAKQAFPVLPLEPSIVQDSVDGGEGVPTPMLSVTGLSLKDLEPIINAANSYLDNSKMFVSLHSGPKAFVITRPSWSLYCLVTSLRKIRGASGQDQSKIPYSQRSPVFSVCFLVVAAPFHSVYLNGTEEDLMEEDLDGGELWRPEDLAIPVYNTENGQSNFVVVTLFSADTFDRRRIGPASSHRFNHEIARRSDFRSAHPLDDRNRLPRHRHTRHRFWPWRLERYWALHGAQFRGSRPTCRCRWRQG
jgi:fatty acid synthase subunit beta